LTEGVKNIENFKAHALIEKFRDTSSTQGKFILRKFYSGNEFEENTFRGFSFGENTYILYYI